MAQGIETEVVDTQEIVRPEAVGKYDSSDKAGRDRSELKGNAPRGKRSRRILLSAAALAVAAVTL